MMEGTSVAELLLKERLRITAVARTILHDTNSADDIFQQVVLVALQTAPEFREPEHVLAWALRTARHRAINLARSRQLTTLDADVLEQLAVDLEELSSDWLQARTEALNQCLDHLPAASRRLLHMRHVEGLDCSTIADRLNRSLDAIYQNLSRLHRALRECIEKRLSNSSSSVNESRTTIT